MTRLERGSTLTWRGVASGWDLDRAMGMTGAPTGSAERSMSGSHPRRARLADSVLGAPQDALVDHARLWVPTGSRVPADIGPRRAAGVTVPATTADSQHGPREHS